jgi:hypothetical protein
VDDERRDAAARGENGEPCVAGDLDASQRQSSLGEERNRPGSRGWRHLAPIPMSFQFVSDMQIALRSWLRWPVIGAVLVLAHECPQTLLSSPAVSTGRPRTLVARVQEHPGQRRPVLTPHAGQDPQRLVDTSPLESYDHSERIPNTTYNNPTSKPRAGPALIRRSLQVPGLPGGFCPPGRPGGQKSSDAP